MSFFQKIRNIFRSVKESAVAITNVAQGLVRWSPKDYENFAKETYMKNVIAFRCMDLLAKSIASVPWKLFRKTTDGRIEVDNHPVASLLERPNPSESFNYLMIKYAVYLQIAGNSFWERVTPMSGPNKEIPKELYVLRPDKFKIILNERGGLSGYQYNGGINFEVDPVTGKSDILQVKLFHPLDEFWGLSITEPASREIDSSNEAKEFNMKMLQNEGRPGMIATVEGKLPPEQFDRIEKILNDKYGGALNAGKTMILEAAKKITVTPYSWNPKEMDFIESNRELSRNICLAYGIPPMLLGIPGDNTYSNYKEARQAFWEETVLFYLNLFRGEFNNWVFETEDDLGIDYILKDIPAFADKRNEMWKRAQESDFLTINEKREMVEKDPTPGGDVILVPANMIPLGTSPDTNNGEDEDEARNMLVSEGFDDEQIDSILAASKELYEAKGNNGNGKCS